MFQCFLASTKVFLVLKKYKRVDQIGSTPTPGESESGGKIKKKIRTAQKKSNKVVAEQVQNLTKELAGCKQELVD